MPKARQTSMFAATTDPQSTNDQKMVVPSSRASERTLKAVASCSSVLNKPRLTLDTNPDFEGIRLSSQSISAADRRLNQMRKATPTTSSERKLNPMIRAQPNSAAALVGLNHSRFSENISTTVIVS